MYLYFIDGVLWFTCTSPSSLVEKNKTNKRGWVLSLLILEGSRKRGRSSAAFSTLKSLLVVRCPTSEMKGSGKRQERGVCLPRWVPLVLRAKRKKKKEKPERKKERKGKKVFNSQPPLHTTANSNKRYWVHVKYVDTHEQSLFWL